MKQEKPLRLRLGVIWSGLFIVLSMIGPSVSLAEDGAPLYGSKCTACHGPKGEGNQVGPALKGNPFITKGAPAEIKKVIMAGRMDKDKKYPNFMTAMPGGLASEAEADALVIYLKGDLQK